MNASPAWYAIWTRSRHEQVVRDQIVTKGYEAFLPTVAQVEPLEGSKKKVDWPLFPGYCFARFDPNERLPILKCTGVVSIVSFDGELAPIPERGDRRHPPARRERSAVRPMPAHPRRGRWSKSRTVRSRASSGRLVRKGAHARLVLAVDLIGQAVSVEVDAADVKAY